MFTVCCQHNDYPIHARLPRVRFLLDEQAEDLPAIATQRLVAVTASKCLARRHERAARVGFHGKSARFRKPLSTIVTVEAVLAANGYPVMKLIALPLAGGEF